MTTRTCLTGRVHRTATLLVAVGIAGVIVVSGVPAASATTTASGSWPHANGDLANSRDAQGSTISTQNVDTLKEAWAFRLKGWTSHKLGYFSAAPIIQNGVVYLQDLGANVYALDLATGALKWEHVCTPTEKVRTGPNGVAVVDGAVYGECSHSAFALDAATGRVIWDKSNLLSKGQGTFGIQPQVATGRVYLASQAGTGSGGGVLLALNASTGALLWKLNTVLGPDQGVEALGLGSGGAWETPLVSGDGSVTYGIGNPYQTAAEAIAHPSAQLYTDSDVDLTAATGKLRWYYQGVPNDFKDYDMQASPISATVNGTPVVIGSGKMGYVYEMNATTGQLLWKTPVGKHNGHDDDSLRALDHESTLKAPYTYLPGSLGGVLTNMALSGDSIYVVTTDQAYKETTLTPGVGTTGVGTTSGFPTGEVEALNLVTGKVEWDTKVPTVPLGAATVSNDLVFTTLFRGVLVALNASTGAVVHLQKLPTSTNAPIAIAGNMIVVPAGGPTTSIGGGNPQVVAYSVP